MSSIFRVHALVRPKMLDTDIVREATLQRLALKADQSESRVKRENQR
jgi:hypothetical protein